MRENLERAILKELAENPGGYRHALRLVANLKAQKDLIDSEEMGFEFASNFMKLIMNFTVCCLNWQVESVFGYI